MAKQQREHFRIDYPLTNRAKITIGTDKYEVVDVSQRGLKFELSAAGLPKTFGLGKRILGVIEFLVNKTLTVTGEVIRVYDNTVILKLKDEIPLGLMNEEHRYIIQTFQINAKQ